MESLQKTNAVEPPNSISVQERRKHRRYQVTTPENFIVQRAWSYFVQIYLYEDHLIIGEILDISLGGIACKVAYQFDLIDPIQIDVAIALKGQQSEANCFKPVKIPAMLMRAKQVKSDQTCELGIKFTLQNDRVKSQVEQLMQQIS